MKSKRKTKGVPEPPDPSDDPALIGDEATGSHQQSADGDVEPDFDTLLNLLRGYLDMVSELDIESGRTLLDQGII